MSLRSSFSEPASTPCLVAGRPTAPIAAEAVAFRRAHGLPHLWSAQDFEVYLDLEHCGRPAPEAAGGGVA
ncbi:hypothetical protein [Streptomyces daliensis]|uniref:Uncharacterized protein n=1 Tax=Streptomyces daliensis TaxID=299421 RepID=A0A8T4IVP0_9ACTN|nr:hypothetical protein [Streptomyces daliensis]